ncbi:dipeptide ABC transporter ATP-binding protein [Natronorubrum texcoconense]|uniref:Peptide/nickel transport system ATP-binding protein n=1 Tax=Natronorubrum texcoconense TaxID=1095776 RepID=A0A1G8UN20_9EURY|nr:ABC transporter ATP-binding protein [Natronorubrum texcoconense]SDJ55218.1 peptide/nickel transport system ATP-binding protein [Natronorubrum texcoconense]
MDSRLEIDDLRVRFRTGSESVHAVNGATFRVEPGEIVGLVGESGCGKSVTARSIVRLEEPGEIVGGSVRYDGRELTTADDRTLRRLRGRELAMVFQDPSTTLNPVYTVGEQIAEALRVRRDPDHQPFLRELAIGAGSRLRSRALRADVLELLETVGIPRPDERIDAYPHQFSGGMRQRVALAMALARQPSVLIADEPTTALDTTTQAAILERLAELNAERDMSVLLISHDLGVVSALCDRIVVMYDGVVVEQGPADELRSNPAHPYTKALLGCLPHRSEPQSRLPAIGGTPPDGAPPPTGCVFADRCPSATDDCRATAQPIVSMGDDHIVRCGVSDARDASLESMVEQLEATAKAATDGNRSEAETTTKAPTDGNGEAIADRPMLELEHVEKSFRRSDALVDRLLGTDERVPAVDGVSLELRPGETVGLVGESGCGKSTLARVAVGLEEPTDGTVRLRGHPVGGAESRTADQLSEIGVVFQNPGASLNPKRTVGESIGEPLLEAGWEPDRRNDRVDDLCSLVGLSPAAVDRYPTQLSGGQRQRVAIARALALEPSVLVLDEPTAALDVSVQATILNLLAELQADLDLAYLFISHDLGVVRHVADRVAVMYLGTLVEVGPARRTLSSPTHPYTQTLLDSTPGERFDAGSIATETQDALAGEPPSPTDPPSGCAFHPRCPAATEECARREPALESVGEARSRCLYAGELADAERTGLEATAKSDSSETEFDRSGEPPVERPTHDTD